LRSVPQHLGSGPIDMNNLPQDILDCDVCRQRLGLPPRNNMVCPKFPQQAMPPQLATSHQAIAQQLTTPSAGTGRMLGSPGMMSSIVAEQMAKQGYVVEEFKPPQSEPGAIQLGNIPPEARQQFMLSLDLPQGARVLSAEVKGLETITASASKSDSESIPPSSPLPQRTQALEQTISQLQKKLEDEATEHVKLTAIIEKLQSESQKQMASADAANREVLTMLEKRTAEVTELQLKIKSQEEAKKKANKSKGKKPA